MTVRESGHSPSEVTPLPLPPNISPWLTYLNVEKLADNIRLALRMWVSFYRAACNADAVLSY